MFQYLLAFLLINSCYQSLGNPIETNSHVIAKSLLKLSTQCGNEFLSKEIKKYVQPCAQTAPPYNKHQVQCLMFYDINKLLCAKASENLIVIKEDFAASLAEKQDVNTLCKTTNDWIFSNISDYPEYKVHAEFVKQIASCGDICVEEDTMYEANVYCKYFKWGFEILKALAAKSSHLVGAKVISAVGEPDSDSKGDIKIPILRNTAAEETVVEAIPAKEHTEAAAAQTPGKVEAPVISELAENKPTNSQTASSTGPTAKPITSDTKVDEKFLETSNGQADPAINIPESSIQKAEQANKTTSPSAVKPDEAQVLPHPELSKDLLEPSKELPELKKILPELTKDLPEDIDQKDIGNIDQQRPNDDYDSEVNENLGDDDGDDTAMDKLEPETVQHKLVIPTHNRESQKEFYPNTMSDGFTEDGDHFFPFFLTAIILVVLLYVLYHNKNKVSKVFFGLVFEGRQTSRRRNSRGHAYRRLDTLEQAMNANAAAPPSKIIY